MTHARGLNTLTFEALAKMRGINVIIIIIIIIIIIMLCYIGRVIAASTFVLSDFFVCLIL